MIAASNNPTGTNTGMASTINVTSNARFHLGMPLEWAAVLRGVVLTVENGFISVKSRAASIGEKM
jgi:hypothetical protein